jgi:hypothetical protein
MIRFFLKLIVFLLITEKVFACSVNFKTFGSKPDFNNLSTKPISFDDRKGGLTFFVPIENFCRDKILFGTVVIFYYFNNELVKIGLERHNYNDRELLKLAVRNYGNFNRSLGKDEKKWVGMHVWQTNNDIINFVAVDNEKNRFEKLEISSKKYINQTLKSSPLLVQ